MGEFETAGCATSDGEDPGGVFIDEKYTGRGFALLVLLLRDSTSVDVTPTGLSALAGC